jgi:hypothetical protein
MADSFRKIDYSIRPAKYAERRMLCDVFRRLNHFQQIENYLYVGFGSVWFSDFILFHRTLGFKDMISIEQAVASKDRFEANKPFWIHIDFRPSSVVLPELDYNKRQVFWLDYDTSINPLMLADAATVASRAKSGTVLIVSVQCVRAPDIAEAEKERTVDPQAISAVDRFRQRFGVDRVPSILQDEDLSGWSFGSLSRNLFVEEVTRVLETRRLAEPSQEIKFQTICEFEYEDGAKMTTLALVFFSPEEAEILQACAFTDLEFLSADNKPVYIHTPKLTMREFRQLESQLPLTGERELDIGFIPSSEARNFAAMYRYLPNFAVIES